MPSPNGTKRLSLSAEQIAEFRAALVVWRKKVKRSRSSVVKSLGISVQQLANIEYGMSDPSERVYLALCAKMGRRSALVSN